MSQERKHYSAEEKVAILQCHLLDKVPVFDLCEELGLRPTVFYRWQNHPEPAYSQSGHPEIFPGAHHRVFP